MKVLKPLKLVPQDPNDEPASVLLERIRAEKERLISEGKIKRSRKTVKTADMHHYENDVPFDVPKGWVWTTLGEIGNWQSGATPSRVQKEYYGGTIPWLKTGDLDDGLITEIPEKITEKALEETSVRLNPSGSVLIAMYGATIGKVGILTYPATTNQACCACIDYKINQMFLFYYLLANRETFVSIGGGGAQPNISKEKIVSFPLPLPPLAEQQRIVAEIERWFALIDTIEKSKEGLETAIKQAKNKILDLAIHGKLVPQDPSDEPASELLKRINPKAQITCDNEHYAQLPKGWSIISMQDICKLKDGIKQDNIPLINLDVKYLRGTSAGKVIDSGKFVTANSYMILVDGENSGEVFKTSIDGYQGSTFKLLDIDQNVNEEYILNVINLHRKALRENKVGSAIPHLNKKLFKAISVPLPPYNEQIRIVEAIKSIFNILDAIKESL